MELYIITSELNTIVSNFEVAAENMPNTIAR